MNPEQELRKVLQATRQGHRPCVPVVGSGLNVQAAKIAGQREDDWSGLLARIAAGIGVSEKFLEGLPRSNLARWESMLRLWARTKRIEPYQAEVQLQKLACEHLRRREQIAADWQLYRELADARFLDIISLNFDRRIALSSAHTNFVHSPQKCREGPQGETLYRHDAISHSNGSRTRVWYPHGDTNKFSTLKLGVRRYGFHLVTLEESRQRFGEQWRVKRSWDYSPGDYFRNQQDAAKPAPKWTNVLLGRTIVFIGCGLSLDEWALWWMIRSRTLAAERRDGDKRAHTFYVGVGTGTSNNPPRSLFAQHGIVTIDFNSFDDLWNVVRSALT